MTLEISRLLDLTTWRAFDVTDDGRVLAGCDESGSVQLVELAEDRRTELTALPGAVSGRYLPGERAVVVQHDSDGNERGQLSLLRLDDRRSRPAPLSELEPLVRDPDHVHRLLDVLPGRIVYATNRRNGVDFDVIIRSVATGEEHVVHDGGGMVAEVSVSPDSRFAAITVPAAKPLSDQVILADTMPETGADRRRELTGRDLAARHLHPGWHPAGLVVTSDADRDRTGIARLDPRTGDRRWLITSDAHDLSGRLSPNGRTLLVTTAVDGAHRLALHDAGTGEHLMDVALPAEGWCGYPLPEPAWSPDSRFAAVSFSSPTTPGDVLLVDTATGTCKPLTFSAAQLAGEPLAEPAVHRVRARDGEQIPCFRYAPAEPDGSAVLLIHGGPESQSVRAFHPLVQAMVARGHTVLVPNVRGSTGYGKRWYSADDTRRRLDSVDDLADLHRWLPAVGLDPNRAALWGGSYGGYMVLAGLAFQPELWAAGVDIVGISSLVTFLENTAPYRRAHREREYGSLTADADFLRAASPLNRASAIAAPLFVLHGANDPRVPLSEAEQIVEAVRANDVPCEFHVYPDEGHGLAKRANRLDAYPKALDFLGRWLS
ncbi:S9 family peptidase [Saccharopolyspora sp. TS4A08]|uniref:S9 family peptidase n=1 Tax=Saccharopolyspora ipomoeae TaxID=3042027 RepID=A0ABT6PVS4_9PSEU|nr:S9 family peptidase [Saccharopolyspora sp. TS4A08]MDI2032113.1 S9 family peptidase [Saccharopolyspora sp. TS4A08]